MSTLPIRHDNSVMDVHCNNDSVIFDLIDGRTISAPLVWFPRLLSASHDQRANWKLIGRGEGVHWLDIDEDISVNGLMGLPD